MDDIFVSAILTDKVRIKSNGLCKNKEPIIHDILVQKFEGKCSYHGYIKRDSIRISKCSAGVIDDVSLKGYTDFTVAYHALVCNPVIGSVVRAKVVNQNKFGILAEVAINGTDPVLEIIITKMVEQGEPALGNINVGDMINVEILKKKFELGDEKIKNVGRITSSPMAGGDARADGGDDDDDLIDEDDGVDEEVAEEEEEEDEEEEDKEGEEEEDQEEEDEEEDGASLSGSSDADEEWEDEEEEGEEDDGESIDLREDE
jgi:DNA-directed RNA polymerase subunit E'/Rpb7